MKQQNIINSKTKLRYAKDCAFHSDTRHRTLWVKHTPPYNWIDIRKSISFFASFWQPQTSPTIAFASQLFFSILAFKQHISKQRTTVWCLINTNKFLFSYFLIQPSQCLVFRVQFCKWHKITNYNELLVLTIRLSMSTEKCVQILCLPQSVMFLFSYSSSIRCSVLVCWYRLLYN